MKKNQKSFTLIEILVGTSLLLIVFLGIFGLYQLGLKTISHSKNKIVATAIAEQEIEKIRNLDYDSVGVKDGFPNGTLEANSVVNRNNVQYLVERRVDYVIDSLDGIVSPDDDCPNDYKKAEIKISWSGQFPGKVEFFTDITPKNLSQECSVLGGILSVSVFNAYGIMVASPLIEIKNPSTDQVLKTATPNDGKHYFSLEPSVYKVAVSKQGYSKERTYGTEEITTPEKPHPSVLQGSLTEISFSIDNLSSFFVDTLSPWGQSSFSDSFIDESKISEKFNTLVNNGQVNLNKNEIGEYLSSGYLISTSIFSDKLLNWKEFSFNDSEPENTDLKYQIYYLSGENWVLIPDADLPGNSQGFDSSSVDLSGLNISTYSQLRIKANFSTTDVLSTPVLYDWQITWQTSDATPIPNVVFNLQGLKIIGTDEQDKPVYKYSVDHNSGPNGHKDISDLEWDSYTFSIDPDIDLDLTEINPSPQPIGLSPNAGVSVKLYFEAENSLLITVQNIVTMEPVFSASVRLYNLGLNYDITQYTDEKGQTLFIPLEPAVYNLEISFVGYNSISTTVSVSGDTIKTINMEQIE